MVLPFLGSPLNIRNDFSALAVRPFDASQDGVSGIGMSRMSATTQMAQLMPLTKRQFVCKYERFPLQEIEMLWNILMNISVRTGIWFVLETN